MSTYRRRHREVRFGQLRVRSLHTEIERNGTTWRTCTAPTILYMHRVQSILIAKFYEQT